MTRTAARIPAADLRVRHIADLAAFHRAVEVADVVTVDGSTTVLAYDVHGEIVRTRLAATDTVRVWGVADA